MDVHKEAGVAVEGVIDMKELSAQESSDMR